MKLEDFVIENVFKIINLYVLSLEKLYQEAQSNVDRDIIRYKIEAIDDLYKLFRIAFLNKVDEYDEWLERV
jgi:hypothetical protein